VSDVAHGPLVYLFSVCVSSHSWNLPASQGGKQALIKKTVIFACCVDVEQQKFDLNSIYQQLSLFKTYPLADAKQGKIKKKKKVVLFDG
jgi:hypothetical protein